MSSIDPLQDHKTDRLRAMRDELSAQLDAYGLWITERKMTKCYAGVALWTPTNAEQRRRFLVSVEEELQRRAEAINEASLKLRRLHYQIQLAKAKKRI